MRIGYSFWGFLGDIKLDANGNELSTPDGNATYSWAIVWDAIRRGHTVFPMQELRDRPGNRKLGWDIFNAFSKSKRLESWLHLRKHDASTTFPELDVLLLEWRFPIPGRNCEVGSSGKVVIPTDDDGNLYHGYQPDLFRQRQLFEHYAETETKIIIWDLDHKLTYEDEDLWSQYYDAIIETSVRPLDQHFHRRIRVEPPIVTSDLLQFETQPAHINEKLTYIGSRYERDDVVDRWIKPVSERFPYDVHFWGKWDGDCRDRWPKIDFCSRITTREFHTVYRNAAAVPLLGKQSYMETGFITPRPWEALMFGSLPIGLRGHLGVESYCLDVAENAQHLGDLAERYSRCSLADRDFDRKLLTEQLEFMDVRNFVDVLENV